MPWSTTFYRLDPFYLTGTIIFIFVIIFGLWYNTTKNDKIEMAKHCALAGGQLGRTIDIDGRKHWVCVQVIPINNKMHPNTPKPGDTK